MIKLESTKLWLKIEKAAISAHHKEAAVAYVSDDSHVKFTKGDILIVDASDEQIANCSTSAQILEDALQKGVKLYSYPNLHAKLMVFDNTVIISSANISGNSKNTLKEAGIITDSPDLVKEALKTIEDIKKKAQPINKSFISRIKKIEQIPRTGFYKKSGKLNTKPTLLEAFKTSEPFLEDFEIMLVTPEATLTDKKVKEAAKKENIKLPASNRWCWYEFDKSFFPFNKVKKKFYDEGMRILSFYVKANNNSIQSIDEIDTFNLICINHLNIGEKVVLNCLIDQKTPFKITNKSTKQFCKELTKKIQSTPALGKKLCRNKGWFIETKEIRQILMR